MPAAGLAPIAKNRTLDTWRNGPQAYLLLTTLETSQNKLQSALGRTERGIRMGTVGYYKDSLTNKKRIGYKGRVLSVEEATFKREEEEERKAAERAEKTAHAAQRAAEKAEKAQRTINRVSKAKPSTAETSPSESEATLAVEGEDNDQPVLGRLFNDDMAFIREEALRKAREGMETVELMLQNHRVSENPHNMKVVDRQRVGGDSESKGGRTRSKSKKKVNSAVNIDDC